MAEYPTDLDQARRAKAKLLRLLEGTGSTAAIGISRSRDTGSYFLLVEIGDAQETCDFPDEIDGVSVRSQFTGPHKAL